MFRAISLAKSYPQTVLESTELTVKCVSYENACPAEFETSPFYFRKLP